MNTAADLKAVEGSQENDPLITNVNKKAPKNLFSENQSSAIDKAGCCSRFFFSWARPILRVSVF